jgi:DNA replication protein DnaC
MVPAKVQKQLPTLCEGGFVERGENLLAFGLPGRGKTHIVCAIGHELVQRGYPVLFTPTYALVQRLLAAKRDLRLDKELAALDAFDAVILDDIGYVQQSREEMEVLFTFLSERYERKSVIITSNLLFSEWDRIFKDPMTTAAAIDRLVHHAVILEMTGPSIRNEEAKKRGEPMTMTLATVTNKEPSGKEVDEKVRLSLTDERRGEKRGDLTSTTPVTITSEELSGKAIDGDM